MSQWQTAMVVLGVLTWWLSPPSSLGDLARRESFRRQMTPKSERALILQETTVSPGASQAAGSSTLATGEVEPPAADEPAGLPGHSESAATAAPHDEAWWRARIVLARADLERDQLLADAMQTRINSLTNDVAARDDPAQRAVLMDQRLRSQAELERLNKAVVADRKAIDDIAEEARKQGVPPGWIRSGQAAPF